MVYSNQLYPGFIANLCYGRNLFNDIVRERETVLRANVLDYRYSFLQDQCEIQQELRKMRDAFMRMTRNPFWFMVSIIDNDIIQFWSTQNRNPKYPNG